LRRLALAVALLSAVTAYAQLGSARRGISQGTLITPASEGIISGLKGVPFSADTVTETSRTLADGNHINQVTRGSVYRDSEGRTRHEFARDIPGQEDARSVSITDPVQQLLISFTTFGERVATVRPMHRASSAASTSTSTSSTATSTPATAASASTITAPANARSSNTATDRSQRHVREDLGTREIEGFVVRGTRTTTTTEAGAIGNDQPIVSVTESWYSEELRQKLLSETDDPQYGHRTTRLVNIQRTEPDPALFQVPPDYSVREP